MNSFTWYRPIMIWILLNIGMQFSLQAKVIKIMPIGDSITEGISQIPDRSDQNSSQYTSGITITENMIAYRGKLWDLLKNEGYEIDFVGSKSSGQNYPSEDFDLDHEGHGGQSSAYIKANITSYMSANPDIVLLQIGTNDPGKGIPIGSYDDINQNNNTSVNNVKSILNTIFTYNPNAKVFVSRIIEARLAHGWVVGWTTTAYNDKIEQMVNNHSHSENIRMVDMQNGAGFEYDVCGLPHDMQPYHSDNENKPDFHPNANGYVKMAQKWFDALVASSWLSLNTDITAPIITLKGNTVVYVELGTPYVDQGATATDDIDGNISGRIVTQSTVDTNTPGSYSVTYQVTDNSANSALPLTRTVVVRSTTTPLAIWYSYDKENKIATISTVTSLAKTVLKVDNTLESSFTSYSNSIALEYNIVNVGMQAYIEGNNNAHVTTGFKNSITNSTTLRIGSFFKAGTKSVMQRLGSIVMIETTTKLEKNETLLF